MMAPEHVHPPGAAAPGPDYRYCPRCAASLAPRRLKTGEPDRLVCGACAFVFYIDPKVAVGAVVRAGDGILLLRRAIEPGYGQWVFPGGFMDRGEHPEEAAAREAMEEAGVQVRLTGLLGVYNEPRCNPVVLIVYRGEIEAGEPAALDESLEARCFPPGEVPWGALAFPSTRAALRDYLRWLQANGG